MSKLRLTMIVVAVALVLGLSPGNAFAQQACHDFRALYHQTLWVNLETNDGTWFTDPDPIRGLFDLQPVTPTVEYIPGTPGGGKGVSGRYSGFQKVWDFGNGDTFTVGNYHAIFPTPPGNAGMGTFIGTGKINGGTGKFQGATGTETETGPYLMWSGDGDIAAPCVAGSPCLTGKYNATITIRVCTN